MQWIIRTVFLLTLTSAALAKKRDYWWMFPNFNENGSNNRENSTTNISQVNFLNVTDGQAANFSSIVDGDFNLSSNVDIDVEYEHNLAENGGRGNSKFPDEDFKWDNKADTTNENIAGPDSDQDLHWVADKASEEDQPDATTFTNGADFKKDYETDIEQENPSSLENFEKAEFLIDLMNKEEDEDVQVEGDAHSSFKLEENRNDDDFSGDHELTDEKAEINELDQITEEQDKAVHEDGDVHPSSKMELEEIRSETEDSEDLDFHHEEKDGPVHEHGDAHPSSKFELEEINDNGEDSEYSDTVDETSLVEGEFVPEEVKSTNENTDKQDFKSDDNEESNNSSSEESQENNEENPIKENFELLKRIKNDDEDSDFSIEDVLTKDEENETEIALKLTQDDEASAPIPSEAETVGDKDETEPITDEELSPVDSNDEYEPLHWVNKELLETDNYTVNNESSEDNVIADIKDTSPVVPIAPIIKAPCSFDIRPFKLTVLPVNSIIGMHGTDVSLLCELALYNESASYNESEKMPYFRLTWLFEKEGCQKDASDKYACTSVLTSKNFESPNSSYTLSYDLKKLNHTIHTGLYVCDAEIYGCHSQNQDATHASQALYLRVYTKPNYAFHIGIISSVCVLLLAILAGLISYARRVQRQSKNRYQELLSSTDIQYFPSKVLELPNSVYNPTTTGFIRMSASSFSSKSSFTSNDDV